MVQLLAFYLMLRRMATLFLHIFGELSFNAFLYFGCYVCLKNGGATLGYRFLILGGALGNLIDRITLGYVVDFIHVYCQNHRFPAFNIADSAITLSTILLLIDTFFLEKQDLKIRMHNMTEIIQPNEEIRYY